MSHFLRALAPAQEGKREKPAFTKSLLTVYSTLMPLHPRLGEGDSEAWSPSPLPPQHTQQTGIEPLSLHFLHRYPPDPWLPALSPHGMSVLAPTCPFPCGPEPSAP